MSALSYNIATFFDEEFNSLLILTNVSNQVLYNFGVFSYTASRLYSVLF